MNLDMYPHTPEKTVPKAPNTIFAHPFKKKTTQVIQKIFNSNKLKKKLTNVVDVFQA